MPRIIFRHKDLVQHRINEIPRVPLDLRHLLDQQRIFLGLLLALGPNLQLFVHIEGVVQAGQVIDVELAEILRRQLLESDPVQHE